MTLQETLANLDRLEASAHKAPWAFEKWHNGYMDKDFGRVSWDHASYGGLPVEDAEFIVSMRNAYPALRANIERLQVDLSLANERIEILELWSKKL